MCEPRFASRGLLQVLFVLLGCALLWLAAREVDAAALWQRVVAFGAAGMLIVVGVYAVEFALDTVAWQLTLGGPRRGWRWFGRLYAVRMAGEAVNSVTPLAGLGGEPVKALMLRRHHGVGLGESASSLVAARTVNMVALVVFLAVALVLMAGEPRLAPSYRWVAAVGFVALAAATAALFLVQRFEWSSAFARRVARWPGGAPLVGWLDRLEAFDRRLVSFYVEHRAKFAVAVALALGNWVVGAIGVWVSLALLGTAVTAREAWMIEAVTQLVRAGTFFIPANLGAQEGAFVVVCSALTGRPDAGFAVALVRRFRDLLWIGGGLGLGAMYRSDVAGRDGESRAKRPASGHRRAQ